MFKIDFVQKMYEFAKFNETPACECSPGCPCFCRDFIHKLISQIVGHSSYICVLCKPYARNYIAMH